MPSRTPCRRTQEKYSRPWDTGSTTRCLRTMSPRLWWERRVSGEKQSAETGSMALTIRAAAPGWRTATEHKEKESDARGSRQTAGLEHDGFWFESPYGTAGSPLPLWERHRPPTAAVLWKDAEAKLRLCRIVRCDPGEGFFSIDRP